MHWARCPAWCSVVGRIFLVEGIFPLELTWVWTLFPQNSFRWEYEPSCSLCTHVFHHTDPLPWRSCPRRVNASNKNTPSMHHSRRGNVTTSMVGLKFGHICKSLTKNGEPQIYSWGTQKKKRNTSFSKSTSFPTFSSLLFLLATSLSAFMITSHSSSNLFSVPAFSVSLQLIQPAHFPLHLHCRCRLPAT